VIIKTNVKMFEMKQNNSFSQSRISLIPKPDKDIAKIPNYG
jgi:hypothetical protein